MSPSWQLTELCLEPLRNLRATPVRTAATVGLAALVLGGLALVELDATERVLALRAELDERGAHVFIVRAEDGLPAARCEALRGLTGVRSAGGVRLSEPVAPLVAPRLRFQAAAVTTGILPVWDPGYRQAEGTGFVIGRSVADELAVDSGARLTLADGRRDVVADILDVDDRYPEAARWIVEVVPPSGRVSECWVEFSPSASGIARDLLAAWFEGPGNQVEVRWLRPPDEFARDPARELATRPQAAAWLPLGGVVGLLAALVSWLRRSEAALYAVLGVRKWGLVLMAQLEAVVVVSSGYLLGVAWAAAIAEAVGGPIGLDQVALAGRSAASAALVAMLAAPAGVIPILRWRVVDLLRDR
jgi:hypothetical protein